MPTSSWQKETHSSVRPSKEMCIRDRDKVDYKGTGQSYTNGTGLSWQHFTEGTGKYDGISGWLNTSLVTNPTTGVHTITVLEGQATYIKQ